LLLSAPRGRARSEATATAVGKAESPRATKKRRTKGPSEKIRHLAALSLSPKIGYLKLNDLIGTGNPELESLVNDRMPRRTFKPGDTIAPTDRAEPMLYLVKSGLVRVHRPSAAGRIFPVKTVEPGTIFGEMPLLGQSMLGAEAEAIEKTEIVLISAVDIEMIAAASPTIALNIVRQLGPRLVEAERRHEQAAFQPVTSRIASLLLRMADQANQVLGLTHQDMADMLGVYRETVTNALAELKHDRLIKIGRKKIFLLNLEGLGRLQAL
jgi:CRP/FNR family transcriptional regulator, cyclic AMP receptor protein